jgi:dTDP-4-dehydrorhamnose reductase
MRILITGASGQLGQAMVGRFAAGHTVLATTAAELDVTDAAAVRVFVAREAPHAIINCAAYTNVDGAEDQPVEALEVNAFAVRSLAAAASAAGAALVHYSTDFVFDGHADKPYSETDVANPRSTYACSKLVGEWFALETPRHYVLRVESLFGGMPDAPGARRTSIDRIVDALVAGDEARVFVDRTVSPSYTVDVALATLTLLERALPAGIYHCANSGCCTWYELAQEVARQLGMQPRLLPISLPALSLRAKRPIYCALSNAKLAAVGVSMPPWQDALARYLRARAVVK